MEMLSRETLVTNQIFIIYNAQIVFLWIGQRADPALLLKLFKTELINHVNMAISEEEMFAESESEPSLAALYNLIN